LFRYCRSYGKNRKDRKKLLPRLKFRAHYYYKNKHYSETVLPLPFTTKRYLFPIRFWDLYYNYNKFTLQNKIPIRWVLNSQIYINTIHFWKIIVIIIMVCIICTLNIITKSLPNSFSLSLSFYKITYIYIFNNLQY